MQIFRQHQKVTAFFQGALRDVEVPAFVRSSTLLESFCNICRYGYC
jgi:hypothetical protein